MNRKNKIQYLLISHLLREGQIELTLPDGIVLELGITREGKDGAPEICSDYCWVVTSQGDRKAFLDSYDVGLTISGDVDSTMFFEDIYEDQDGQMIKAVDVC